jgi:hypothetical protein
MPISPHPTQNRPSFHSPIPPPSPSSSMFTSHYNNRFVMQQHKYAITLLLLLPSPTHRCSCTIYLHFIVSTRSSRALRQMPCTRPRASSQFASCFCSKLLLNCCFLRSACRIMATLWWSNDIIMAAVAAVMVNVSSR